MTKENICIGCGKKSKEDFKYRVVDLMDVYRDFCSADCLIRYYKRHNSKRK